MNMEMIAKKEKLNEMAMYKSCAKALYLVGNLEQMVIYLESLVDAERITEDEEREIEKSVSSECADMAWGDIREIRRQF